MIIVKVSTTPAFYKSGRTRAFWLCLPAVGVVKLAGNDMEHRRRGLG
jgi:hypothetical protein